MLHSQNDLKGFKRDDLKLIAESRGIDPSWIKHFGSLNAAQTYAAAIQKHQEVLGDLEHVPICYLRPNDTLLLGACLMDDGTISKARYFEIIAIDEYPYSHNRLGVDNNCRRFIRKRGTDEHGDPWLLLERGEYHYRVVKSGTPGFEPVNCMAEAQAYLASHYEKRFAEYPHQIPLCEVFADLPKYTNCLPGKFKLFLDQLQLVGRVRLKSMPAGGATSLGITPIWFKEIPYFWLKCTPAYRLDDEHED